MGRFVDNSEQSFLEVGFPSSICEPEKRFLIDTGHLEQRLCEVVSCVGEDRCTNAICIHLALPANKQLDHRIEILLVGFR